MPPTQQQEEGSAVSWSIPLHHAHEDELEQMWHRAATELEP